MGTYYNSASRIDTDTEELEHRITHAKTALKQLRRVERIVGETSTGDAEFDVELTIAINVARVALLRLQTMLAEQVSATKPSFAREEITAHIPH